MIAQTTHDTHAEFELPEADTQALKDKQSVRATFRLSEDTILVLNVVSNQLGVKQKSLFDHLIADADALETIARELKRAKPRQTSRIPKTVVISRRTLTTLQKVVEAYDAPRDALVEFSIQRLRPIIAQEKAKLKARRQIAIKLKSSLEAQKGLLDQAKQQLGREDPICRHLSNATDRLETAHDNIVAFVEKSEKIMQLD